ncbi:MAG: hypothetical protein AAB557_03225 [Patescibacteria group bacterium]
MRKNILIEKIEQLAKDVFDIADVKKLFPNEVHINTAIKRLVDSGSIVKVARGVYMLRGHSFDVEKLATKLYYPSYISFESALSKYGIINQGLYNLTLATTRHSKKITLMDVECDYSQLKRELFFGFNLAGGTYVAEPEKAVLDMLYLISLGKRTDGSHEWNTEELDKSKLKKYIPPFGMAVKNAVRELIGI